MRLSSKETNPNKMKKLIPILLIIIACNKTDVKEQAQPETKISADDFGGNLTYTNRPRDFAEKNSRPRKPNPHSDRDRDGILNEVDNCPDNYNPLQEDEDGNGIGDECDEATPPPPTTVNYLLLDFDGHNVTTAFWLPYIGSFFAAQANLTTQEIDAIVAEVRSLMAPINCEVITEEWRYNLVPPDRNQRIVITETTDPFVSRFGDIGGVAGIGTWRNVEDIEAFVLPAYLSYDLHFIAVATTHEGGHTASLRHQVDCVDGVNVNDYRLGVIMGIGYYVPVPIWTVGTSSNACAIQYDISQANTYLN